ncbi:MAG TPA: hypothetical protein VM487_24270 [Phycisphaerae bacterium]|nr:hypothetical protein [Phycisphaerae bacterium]
MTDIVTINADSFGPPPMIRPEARVRDGMDGDRLGWAWKHWDSQTNALRLRDRQVEENVRMICGQQYVVWNTLLQKFVDVSHWFSDEERRWRQRPVFNRILPWFMTTHARMVENPPILTFLPGPDQMDAELAEVMDNVFKAVWRDIGMTDVNDRLMTWVIAAGRGYLQTRIDLEKGPLKAWVGEATLPLLNPDTMQPVLDPEGHPQMFTVPDVPFDANGNPLGFLSVDGMQATGEPHFEREGEITVDVLGPLEVRGQWGPQPWHLKRWHATKSYLTPEEVYDTFGQKVEPNTDGVSVDGAGELERLMFGTGYFGAASQRVGSETSAPRATSDKYVEVLTLWHSPTKV